MCVLTSELTSFSSLLFNVELIPVLFLLEFAILLFINNFFFFLWILKFYVLGEKSSLIFQDHFQTWIKLKLCLISIINKTPIFKLYNSLAIYTSFKREDHGITKLKFAEKTNSRTKIKIIKKALKIYSLNFSMFSVKMISW